MNPFAIDLNDRALALARSGSVLSSSPAAIFDGSTSEVVGTGAWHALRSQPTATSSRHLESVLTQSQAPDRAFQLLSADLARRLDAHRPQPGEPVWIAAPAIADPQGLGAVLGIFRELSLPVSGFIDSAAATVAALGSERNAIVIELGLHRVAATAVDVGSGIARRRRSVIGQQGGLIELYQSLLEGVSGAMVRRTRFDPRRDAVTEQQLFDLIPTLVQDAVSGVVTATLRRSSEDSVEVELSRDQLAQAARALNTEVRRLIHELRPAGMPLALVMPSLLSEVPGLRDEIEQFVGCDLITCPDGFAAAAISATDQPISQGSTVHLLRRAPLHELAGQATTRERLGGRKEAGPTPTHVLLEGRALAIGPEPVVVGRAPGTERDVSLPDGLAGVSRRHCTLLRDESELVLLDHSTFGTFVNGERVAERVRVYAGDRIRVGEPGVELALIAVGAQ